MARLNNGGLGVSRSKSGGFAWRLAGVFALAMLGVFPALAGAEVWKVAPKDSLGVLRLKNLEATSKRIGAFATKTGLDADNRELADLYGTMLAKGKIKAGMNKDGDLGIILLPAAAWPKLDMGKDEIEEKGAIVVLLPVSDYKAFLGNFEGEGKAKTEGTITEIKWTEGEGPEKTAYVAEWGEYAAVAFDKANLGKPGEGIALTAGALKDFDANDIVFWANIPEINTALAPQITAHKDEMREKLKEMQAASPLGEKFGGYFDALMTQGLLAATTFLNDATSATVSYNITNAGVNASVAAEFKPGSYLGTAVAGLKGETASFTQGLPGDRPYIFYGGMAGNGEVIARLAKDFSAPLMKEMAAVQGVEPAQFEKYFEAALAVQRSTKQLNFGLFSPTWALGSEPMIQAAYVIKGDAKAFASSFAAAAGPMKMTFKPASKTVEGQTLDVLHLEPIVNPKTPEEAEQAQYLSILGGPDGFTMSSGTLDDQTTIMAVGMSDAVMAGLIKSAKASSDDLGKLPPTVETTKQLPSQSVAVFYFALDEVLKRAEDFARAQGANLNLGVPDGLPPIGFAASAEGTTLRLTSHIPTGLLQTLIAIEQKQKGGGM